MSRIDDLIAEHCPSGVHFKALGDVGQFVRGNGLQKKDLIAEGVGAIHYGQVFTVYGTATSRTRSFVAPSMAASLRKAQPGNLVIATTSENDEDVCRAVAWLGDEAIVVSGDAYVYSHALDPLYAAYFFQTDDFQTQKRRYITGTKVKRLSGRDLARIRIPVPPLPIQREIASILVKMEELAAELAAELKARRRQYDFYRAEILAPGPDWRKVTLREACTVFDGPHATPKKTLEGPWYLSISSLKDGNLDLASSAHLSTDDHRVWTRRVSPRCGDTLFSYETRIGQAAYWNRSDLAALGRRMGLLRPNTDVVSPKFLTIAYLSPTFQSLIESKTVRGSTVDRIPVADMPDWPIFVPPLSEQARIVELIESFDALVNDLAVGLPAELTARRQQYEYYRDRLLTFDEEPA